jgi:hypothetical protein
MLSVSGPQPVPSALTGIPVIPATGGVMHLSPIPASTPLKSKPHDYTGVHDGCSPYPPNIFSGAIAIIVAQSSDVDPCGNDVRVANAVASGAVAVVMSIFTDQIRAGPSVPNASVPVFAVTKGDSDDLRDFIVANSAVSATIGFPAVSTVSVPDVIYEYAQSDFDAYSVSILKPDFLAPGVNILATDAGNALTGFEALAGLKSGTSMAAANHAGAVALVRQAHPNWSVSELKSAFALTAYDQAFEPNGIARARAFSTGGGRIRVDRAINAGLVMHETIDRYRVANPGVAPDNASLNQPYLVNGKCRRICRSVRTFRNPHAQSSTWNLQLDGVAGAMPTSITVPAEEDVSIEIILRLEAGIRSFAQGNLTLTSSDASQSPLRLPILVSGGKPRGDDYDADGRADIHWRNLSTGQSDLWLMNGTAANAFMTIYYELNLTWTVVGSGDFNADTAADLVCRNTRAGQVYLQHQIAGETLATSNFAPTVADQNWKIVAIGDFDGDGTSDLFWRHDMTGQNDLWLMNGSAPYRSGMFSVQADLAWKVVGAGDFNGDTVTDLFWRHQITGRNYVVIMSGFTTTIQGTGYSIDVPDQAWQVAAIDDFDGDGRADVYWRNRETGFNDLWLMDGGAIRWGATVYFEPRQAWKIVNSGDYNDDGFADLLWRNTSTGDNYLMLMRATDVLPGSTMLLRVGDLNWHVTGIQVSN